jgi:phosphocarrier protein
MVSRELKVENKSGIHARPAALIVETCTKFKCHIYLIKDGMRANAKSIMNIMLLAAEPGAELLLEAEGDDATAAADAVEALFVGRFGND